MLNGQFKAFKATHGLNNLQVSQIRARMANGNSIEWFRTELDGPDDYENFIKAMKTSFEKYRI